MVIFQSYVNVNQEGYPSAIKQGNDKYPLCWSMMPGGWPIHAFVIHYDQWCWVSSSQTQPWYDSMFYSCSIHVLLLFFNKTMFWTSKVTSCHITFFDPFPWARFACINPGWMNPELCASWKLLKMATNTWFTHWTWWFSIMAPHHFFRGNHPHYSSRTRSYASDTSSSGGVGYVQSIYIYMILLKCNTRVAQLPKTLNHHCNCPSSWSNDCQFD